MAIDIKNASLPATDPFDVQGLPKGSSEQGPTNKQTEMMDKSRKAASFDSYQLTCLIYGGAEIVRQRRAAFNRVEKAIGTANTSKLPPSYGNMDREQAYEDGLKSGKAAFEDGIAHKHNIFDDITPRYGISNASPFGMTTNMFIPTLRLQATAEQRARWLPLAESGSMLGAYSQTELGHGTFVRGIETTATLDTKTDEFVIHSPTLSSTKFWPGAIGFSCTHSIVLARLIIRNHDYGLHLFMVQFRSLSDGSPMPGIDLGDLGLKMSYNGTCNGYASFNQVRIPRSDMLMGNASVSFQGKYEQSPHAKLSYATMVLVRKVIVRAVAFQLAQAVTIATRYSIVREQGLGPNGLGTTESALIDYKSQHYRLLTLTSQAYAILYASRTCDEEYATLRLQQDAGNHEGLPYNHNLAAGLKAWTTQIASNGAEDARKCCGGQGYVMTSGLPHIVACVTATATFEGENYVLWQQAGRYLFKLVGQLAERKTIDSKMKYLADGWSHYVLTNPATMSRASDGCVRVIDTPCTIRGKQFLDSDAQMSIFRHRALRLLFSTHAALQDSPLPPADTWNEHMMSIINAARAHVELVVLDSFIRHTSTLPSSPMKRVLVDLRSLFALSTITNPASINAISFVEDGYLSLSQLSTIRALVNTLLDGLKPEIVALTDAWDFTDASLCSAIGMKDGNAYETLMSWTRQIPINVNAKKQGGVYRAGWDAYIDPVLRARL